VISFSRAIRQYEPGSDDVLLQQLDEILADGRARPSALLETLDAQESAEALSDALVERLKARIHAHITGQSSPPPSDDALDATQVATSVPMDVPTGEGITRPLPERRPESTVVAPIDETASNLPGAGDKLNDRFLLEELIGQGGMSQVYRAIDQRKVEARSRTPEVAVKLLDMTGLAEESAFMVAQREAQKLQSLSHPNIVRVNDFDRDRDSGVLFTTMEYLTGQPLSLKIIELRGDGMPVELAFEYISKMGEALQYAHDHRIVHADFKPSNVFITEDGRVKVIDFGIARAFRRPEDNPEDRTIFDPRVLGALTPAYASPEMIENHEPDPRDDIYSLACVAYELLTGVHPFSRAKATDARDGQMVPSRPACLSRRQWQAMRSALAFDRAHRTRSVEEFLDGLLPKPSRIGVWVAGGAIAAGLVATIWLWQLERVPEPAPVTESVPTPVEPVPVTEPEVVEIPAPGTLITDCDDCPTVAVLPTGSARVGAAPGDDAYAFEYPLHEVTIDRVIAMGTGEVTVAEFRAFLADTARSLSGGCRTVEKGWEIDPDRSWESPGFDQTDQHPVTCVSWFDAKEYVTWLSDRAEARYRLPSEAEWEYAARMGIGGAAGVGCKNANVADASVLATYPDFDALGCDDGHPFTAAAESMAPNAWGLANMSGNLFEWTEDCWNDSYEGAPTDGGARSSGTCDFRVLRGGSWFTAPREARVTYRNRHPRDYRSNTFGFRVVREMQE
jgi:formylglycine-generating enzyme required for sulfatase activity/tRNA A-37 threonylcarbamoyl transferase component Bud32